MQYRISYVEKDPIALRTHLTAQAIPWSKIIQNCTIDVGKVSSRRLTRNRSRKRSGCSTKNFKYCGKELLDEGEEVGEEIGDKIVEESEKVINITQEHIEETGQFYEDLEKDTENMFDEIEEVNHQFDNLEEKDGNGAVTQGFTPHMQLGRPNEKHTIWDDGYSTFYETP